jgi:hypothetical protein
VLAAVVVLVALAVWAVVRVLTASEPAPPVVEACRATVDEATWTLSPEQADNAALIAATSVRRGLPARAATIGLATAMQESKLVNVDYGDRDSLGLFQQRPSQGWGTEEQVQDPVFATNAFFDALVKVPGYTELPVTEAAQAVQRSAYPEAYAAHEDLARAFASALTGWSPAALTCTLAPADEAGTVAAVAARIARDLGELPATSDEADAEAGTPATVLVDASTLAPDDALRGAWALAQWAVAVADPLAVDAVQVSDQVWRRGTDGWHALGTLATGASDDTPVPAPALGAGQVRLTLAG